MKSRTGMALAAVIALVGTAWAGADSTNQAPAQFRLEFDLVDGSRIIGVPDIASMPVQTAYAKMDIPLGNISAIAIGEDHETASFELRNGDQLKGVLALEPIMLATVFGRVPIGIEHIRELRVVMAGSPGSEVWTSPTTGMEFVWIAQMNMWVGKVEVTNGEYRKKEAGHDSKSHDSHSLNGDRQPVVFVNFDDAKAYAAWLSERDKAQLDGKRYRLPSEQEFMTYVQCGDGREYPWGNNWPPRSGQAGNYHGQEGVGGVEKLSGYNDEFPVTAQVDHLWRNPWGLCGVGGNVWEACASDSSGGSFGAWRGASWGPESQNALRCAYRNVGCGSSRNHSCGFRLVLSP